MAILRYIYLKDGVAKSVAIFKRNGVINMDDINWYCEFVGCNLYWYQKLMLLLNHDFCKAVKHMREYANMYDALKG